MFRQVLIAGMILLLPYIMVAQNTCSQTLIKAQIAYYEGRADEVPLILDACLKDGFTDGEKSQAYRLLTLTHLYLNETQRAENTMLAFLRLNHYYKINEAVDPTEFINLYNQFRTRPVYTITPKIGTNVSMIHVMKNFSLDNTTKINYRYEMVLGYQVGASIEIPLSAKISLNPEIYLSGKNYRYKNNLFAYESLSFSEQQHRIELPVLVMYKVGDKSFNPFFQAGISLDALFNVSAQVYRLDHTNDEEILKEVTGPNVNISSQRKRLNYSAVVGSGLKYKRGKNIFMIDMRYTLGLLNTVKPWKRYSNAELIYKYGYMDNDFKLNSFMLSIGYLMPVYHPKKIARKAIQENDQSNKISN